VSVKPAYGLPPEDMARMLRESMEHAKADIMKRMLEEAKMEAERACIEVESAMRASGELLDENERTLLTSQLRYVREAIAEEDRERMDMEIAELGRIAAPFAEKRMNQQIAQALHGKPVKDAL
jgi:molecular chaperone HscA